jgi:DNA-binding response OmpR family regulator
MPPDAAPSRIETGDLALDRVTRTVTVGGKDVRLKGKEYQLLEFLSLHKNAIHTREALAAHLYGEVDAPETRIIDILVERLRQKLAQSTARIVETAAGGEIGFWLIALPRSPDARGEPSAAREA